MTREDYDVNDPSLYKPRNMPRVESAGQSRLEQPPREASREVAFLFDESDAWNDELMEMAEYPRAVRRSINTGAEVDNPYAKRRAPVRSRGSKTNHELPGITSPRSLTMLYASVIAICVAMLASICVMMMPQMVGYFWKDLGNYAFINGEVLRYDKTLVDNYKQYREYLRQDMIYQGVFVDGVHVGGMSVAEAEKKLSESENTTVNSFSITVNIGNKSWKIDNSNVPATRNLDIVLAQAYAIGRQNTTEIIGTSTTPFRQRANTVMDMLDNYVTLKSTATYDHDVVRSMVGEIQSYVTRDPVNSEILTFDFNTRTFTFSDEQAGVTIDSDALFQQITGLLDRGAVGESITVSPTILTPSITKTDLMNNFKLVSAFTTDTTSSKNRNNNINLACQAINGTVLQPGETFSFNATTGQRTTDKGYESAGAIAAGQSIEEVGGGICQVSSTLFNAVARANLEIVSRSPHAWPSTYVKIGEDATVNWPNLDFQFKNNKTTPVFVIAYYKDRKCSAEIWGMTLGNGVTIDLESKIIKTIEPSTEVLYKQNTSLPTGTSDETVKARTGYVVETYQVWYQNGQETKRSLLHTSTYKAYQRTIEYN